MADSKNDDLIPIPEPYSRRRLNALYREIPLPDTHSRMLRKYFNAMAICMGLFRSEKPLKSFRNRTGTDSRRKNCWPLRRSPDMRKRTTTFWAWTSYTRMANPAIR